MPAQIDIPHEAIGAFCRRWQVSELALFGSVLRPDFRADSDVDVLISFAPEAQCTLFDLADMQEDLKNILGREVHLVIRSGIERSRNYLRREAILNSAEVVYAA